jgi:hypothetical protein
MKSLILCLCIGFYLPSKGQEIELQGRYAASFIGGESINFVGKDSFYFSGFYCTNGVYGCGRCEIRDNLLILYFSKDKSRYKTDPLKQAIISRQETADSFSVVRIGLLNNDAFPVSFATVEATGEGPFKSSMSADSAGQAEFSIDNKFFPLMITSSAIGINPGKLKLTQAGNYQIKLFHSNYQVDKELNHGEVYMYEIDELSEDLLLMRPNKSSEPFRKYRKKKE